MSDQAQLARRGSPSGRMLLLAVILALHFTSRYEAHRNLPLAERHFYPTSYYVSLSLMAGRGFNYLLPAGTIPPPEGFKHTVTLDPAPVPGTPSADAAEFVQLSRRGIPRSTFDRYVAESAAYDPGIWEATRTLDIHVAAALWRVFGISWDVYFAFYALVSTAASLMLFAIARRASSSFGCGLAACIGFLASPLERYAGSWSVRDTSPLWFGALAFGALACCTSPAWTRRPFRAGVVTGVASLVGLGWRLDVQALPWLVLPSLLLLLAVERRPRQELLLAACGFILGCGAVRASLGWLGPARPQRQGSVVFHAAWYGEASRSNLLHTQNAFQASRDDMLTVYQANYFAQTAHGGRARVIRVANDPEHLERARAMYLQLARFNALAWWQAFPSFLVRCLRLDGPTVLGSVAEAEGFYARDQGRWSTSARHLQWYGSLLPWLAGAGLAGGLLHPRARPWTVVLGGLLLYHAATLMVALPEPKHHAALLLPLHTLAALGAWSIARLLSYRRWRERARLSPSGLGTILAGAAVMGALWLGVGAVARELSLGFQRRIVRGILARAPGEEVAQGPAGTKQFRIAVDANTTIRPHGYLLNVRSSKWVDLLCVHQRVPASGEGFQAYFTRHAIPPGRDRLFFFNVVAGVGVGDERAYTAWVRLLGPAEIVSVRRLELADWPFGLPLSFTLDAASEWIEPSFVGAQGPATQALDSATQVDALLSDPRDFLVSPLPLAEASSASWPGTK